MKKTIISLSILLGSFMSNAQSYGIEIPEMNVVFAGIPAIFTGGACGEYKKVFVSPATVTASASQVGTYVTVSASGIDKSGKSVSLGGKKYLVKATPKPELFWNGVGEAGKANKSAGNLTCRFGDNVPFSPSLGQFRIESYSITVSGVKGSLDGSGSTISPAHISVLKEVSGKASISVKYSGTSEGKVTAMFDL
jgi:hypothetical protein